MFQGYIDIDGALPVNATAICDVLFDLPRPGARTWFGDGHCLLS